MTQFSVHSLLWWVVSEIFSSDSECTNIYSGFVSIFPPAVCSCLISSHRGRNKTFKCDNRFSSRWNASTGRKPCVHWLKSWQRSRVKVRHWPVRVACFLSWSAPGTSHRRPVHADAVHAGVVGVSPVGRHLQLHDLEGPLGGLLCAVTTRRAVGLHLQQGDLGLPQPGHSLLTVTANVCRASSSSS